MRHRYKTQQLYGTTHHYMEGQKPTKQQVGEKSGCKDTVGKNASTATRSSVQQLPWQTLVP